MRETIPTAGFVAGEVNHAGYANKTTRDSWNEGWAIFWPAAFHARGVPADAPNAAAARTTYQAGAASFDLDRRANGDKWQATDGSNGNAEDHAVASLLWDLFDTDSPPDSGRVWVQDTSGTAQQLQVQDQLLLDDKTLFSILAARKPEDIQAVYQALNLADLGAAIKLHALGNGVTYNDVDAIFLMHGFYHQRPIGGVSIVDPASSPTADGQWGWTGAKADLGETANPDHPDRH